MGWTVVQRYPYECLGLLVFDAETVITQFRKVDLVNDFGISLALWVFFSEHGRCVRCDGTMDNWERHETCSSSPVRFRNFHPSDLEVALSSARYMSSGALRAKESQLRAAFLRKKRTKAATGTRTREEVRALFDLQERRCYYCFGSLEEPGGSVNVAGEPSTFHEDHYVFQIDQCSEFDPGGELRLNAEGGAEQTGNPFPHRDHSLL